jgi:pyrroline-5-carboxylate reductase
MSTEPVKVGIIGLGRWARVLTRAAKNTDRLKIVSGYSRSEEKRTEFQNEFGVPSVTDMDTMLAPKPASMFTRRSRLLARWKKGSKSPLFVKSTA